MSEFRESIIIESPIEEVWDTLTDIGNIADWHPGVKASEQTSEGPVLKGSTRSCDLGKGQYLHEEVIHMDKPHRITFSIKETNLPIESANIRFTLLHNSGLTKVTVSPLYSMKYSYLGDFIDLIFVRRRYHKGMIALLNGLKVHLENESSIKE